MRAPSFCGVILAAGASSRMGRDKALLPWPPNSRSTFLAAHLERLQPFCDLVVVVAGANAPNLAPIIYSASAYLARNPAPERGQFSSWQIGMQEVLNRGRDAAVVALVDRPPAAAATVAQLRAEFLASDSRQTWAVVPEHEARHGHPIIIAREMIEAFLRAPATSNAREVEHANQSRILYVPVADPMITANVDTPEQYEQLVKGDAETRRPPRTPEPAN
jgi:molybdenum cofactor cytidylyltransferase